mmetsp:Transcript_151094/g.384027  ORF Transcript_151094/g.384027 Transcript_151094/m.384027 type:complete len:363 (+) Transcript_151094:3-1091(+)
MGCRGSKLADVADVPQPCSAPKALAPALVPAQLTAPVAQLCSASGLTLLEKMQERNHDLHGKLGKAASRLAVLADERVALQSEIVKALWEVKKREEKLKEEKTKLEEEKTKLEARFVSPDYWRNRGEGHMVPVSQSKDGIALQLTRALELMLKTSAIHSSCKGRDGTFNISSVKRLNVWRVENTKLWRRYRNKAEELGTTLRQRKEVPTSLSPRVSRLDDPTLPRCLHWWESFDHELNEVYLWHGTTKEKAEAIAMHGMDPRVSRLSGMFGAGLYFAENSCKSGQYAAKDSNNSHWFFLCRVMLGNPWITGSAMPDIRREPNGYDSVVYKPWLFSTIGHHREFVVYDGNQVYPEYLVEACTE